MSFNGALASFTRVSLQQVTATVPGGATTCPIGVTAPIGAGLSHGTFTVTP